MIGLDLDVRFDTRQIERRLTDIQRRLLPRAASRAINRAIDQAATSAAREISQATKIPVRDVRQRLQVRKASPSRLIAELRASGYAPNLSKFRATQRRDGVAATAWEGRKTYKGAFILPNGRVVTRRSGKATPLKSLRGPSVRSTFATERVRSKAMAIAQQVWRARFEREVARMLGGAQ